MQTVRDLLEYVRESRLDDAPDSVETDWFEDDTDLLWSNLDLIRYMRLAVSEFTRRRPIRDSQTESVCSIAVPAGSHPVIDIDENVLAVHTVKLTSQDTRLTKRYLNNQLEDLHANWRDYDGEPVEYLEDMDDHKIRILGVLDADDTAELVVDRMAIEEVPWPTATWAASTCYDDCDMVLPTTWNGHYYAATVGGVSGATEPASWPTDGTSVVDGTVEWTDQGLVGDVAVPEVARRYYPDLADWMCREAYMKQDTGDESGTYNPVLVEFYEGRFDERVGPPRSARAETERRRTANLRQRSRKYY